MPEGASSWNGVFLRAQAPWQCPCHGGIAPVICRLCPREAGGAQEACIPHGNLGWKCWGEARGWALACSEGCPSSGHCWAALCAGGWRGSFVLSHSQGPELSHGSPCLLLPLLSQPHLRVLPDEVWQVRVWRWSCCHGVKLARKVSGGTWSPPCRVPQPSAVLTFLGMAGSAASTAIREVLCPENNGKGHVRVV